MTEMFFFNKHVPLSIEKIFSRRSDFHLFHWSSEFTDKLSPEMFAPSLALVT